MAQELKAYNVVATVDVNPEVVDSLGCTEWAGYDKDEVDAVLAEKDAEIRRLKRALWLARAWRAKERQRMLPNNKEFYMWQDIERKCRDKAEEYK